MKADNTPAIIAGVINSLISLSMITPVENFKKKKFKTIAPTTETNHAINFSPAKRSAFERI